MTSPDLASLLAPFPVADFVERHWEKRSLYVQGARGRFADVFDRERFLAAARQPRGAHSGDPRRLRAGFRDAHGEHAELGITAAQVEPLLKAGMTVQVEWLHESDPVLGAFVDEVRRALRVPVTIDVAGFLSPEGSGYGLHFDTTSMLVLQLQGTKRWHFAAEPAVARPVSNVIPDAAARASGIHGFRESDLTVQELAPGDALFLPAGAWHHVKATSESLHICLTIRPVDVLDLAHDLLLDDLLEDVAWRSLPERPGTEDEAYFAARLEALRAAVQRLTPAMLHDAWRARAGDDGDEAPGIEPGDVLEHAAPIRWRRATVEGEAAVQILRDAEVIGTMPRHAEAFLLKLKATPRFRADEARQWVKDYPWADVAMLLGEFLSLGMLRREREL